MSFDRYLGALDGDAGGDEQVAVAIYYLEEVEGEGTVSQADASELIQRSRATIAADGTSMYFTRLKDDRWITRAGDDGYRLTNHGKGKVEAMLDGAVPGAPRREDDLFIDTRELDDEERYRHLVEDINRCYRHRIYDATMVLTRKLFEDLTFQVLRTHYAGEDPQMFYDAENSRHYRFGELLTNLRDGVPDLRQYSRELDRGLVGDLRNLKDEGNAGAHAVRVGFTDAEVEAWSTDATRMAEVLYDVLKGARLANNK